MTCSNCFFSVKKHNPHLKGNKAKYERPWPRDTDLGHRKLHVPVCLELHVVFVLTKQRELYTKAFFIYMGGNSRQTGLRFNLMTFLRLWVDGSQGSVITFQKSLPNSHKNVRSNTVGRDCSVDQEPKITDSYLSQSFNELGSVCNRVVRLCRRGVHPHSRGVPFLLLFGNLFTLLFILLP